MRWMISIFIFLTAIVACSSWSRNNSTGVGSDEILHMVSRGKAVQISDRVISDAIDFTALNGIPLGEDLEQITIDVPLVFEGCTFDQPVRAQGGKQLIRFNRAVIFRECTFKDSVLISRTEFDRQLIFERCVFEQTVDARATLFHSMSSFRSSEFKGDAFFQSSSFDRKTSFFKSRFRAISNFQHASFNGNADFGATKFEGYTEFSHTHFREGAFFSYLESTARLLLNYAVFHDRLDLLKVSIKGRAEFRGNTFFFPPRIEWTEGADRLQDENNTVLARKPIAIN